MYARMVQFPIYGIQITVSNYQSESSIYTYINVDKCGNVIGSSFQTLSSPEWHFNQTKEDSSERKRQQQMVHPLVFFDAYCF